MVQTSEDGEARGKAGLPGCCTCSQTSGCKKKKYDCRLGGGLCGAGCSCKASKCANANREFDASDTPGTTSVGQVDNQEELARHGAKLLDTLFKEELTAQIAPTTPKRRPLSDIGNNKVVISCRKPGKQKRKSQKPVVQLVTSEPSTTQVAAITEAAGASESATATAATVVAAAATTEENVHVAPVMEQQAVNGIPLSPLRARNRQRSRDGVKRVTTSEPAPKPADEKENIR